jgi:C-terminal processing protease CtpA/Prc
MHPNDLWNVFSDMLCLLNDGHASLSNDIKWTNRWNCEAKSYATNFDYNLIINNYLEKPLKYSGPLLYDIIDSIGYVYYTSFESTISGANMDFLVDYFKDTKGLIIDIRVNGGGDSENGDVMESRLVRTKILVEYIFYKNGPGHNDFTSPQALYISPQGSTQYTKPIAVLINRDCFSSASFFASRMSVLENVSLIGDTTSGGAGRPKYFDLPNGWIVRYSSNYALRADGFNFENGVPPDFWVEMKDSDSAKGIDTILEYAISWINSLN